MKTRLHVLCLALGLAAIPTVCVAQSDVDSQLEELRADVRADKVDLIAEAMKLNDNESKLFWPIYRRYDTDLASLNDKRIALIKEYAAKFSTMSDSDAKAMLDKGLDFETERAELKKKYAKKFEKAGVSALTTAKFFQLEHRLDALVDLKLASELPSLLVRKTAQ
jgi:hypothetical protein